VGGNAGAHPQKKALCILGNVTVLADEDEPTTTSDNQVCQLARSFMSGSPMLCIGP